MSIIVPLIGSNDMKVYCCVVLSPRGGDGRVLEGVEELKVVGGEGFNPP